MDTANIVLIVVDTLRRDVASDWGAFRDLGFVKYDDAIATSSWTLPSHVSMFTGELPSEHGIHESLGVYGPDLISKSRAKMKKVRHNLLESLRVKGYSRICLTANPYISTYAGFDFDLYKEFNHRGDLSAGTDFLWEGKSLWLTGVSLIKARKIGTLLTYLWWKAKTNFEKFANRPRMEKGSSHIIAYLERAMLPSPYFLFVNAMEAHEPYRWKEKDDQVMAAAVLGRPAGVDFWKEEYPQHARFAIEKVLEISRIVMRHDPLIIVTSDHGQLLGEHGRYGHGYFLDEELLKVPLYVRYPEGTPPLKQANEFISLTELPSIIDYILTGKEVTLGSASAVSESFGSQLDLSRYADKELMSTVYSERVRAFLSNGSVLFNRSERTVESTEGRLSEQQVTEIAASLGPKGGTSRSEDTAALSPAEEALLVQRLKELGYT